MGTVTWGYCLGWKTPAHYQPGSSGLAFIPGPLSYRCRVQQMLRVSEAISNRRAVLSPHIGSLFRILGSLFFRHQTLSPWTFSISISLFHHSTHFFANSF